MTRLVNWTSVSSFLNADVSGSTGCWTVFLEQLAKADSSTHTYRNKAYLSTSSSTWTFLTRLFYPGLRIDGFISLPGACTTSTTTHRRLQAATT
jgi:hypothetical protein